MKTITIIRLFHIPKNKIGHELRQLAAHLDNGEFKLRVGAMEVFPRCGESDTTNSIVRVSDR